MFDQIKLFIGRVIIPAVMIGFGLYLSYVGLVPRTIEDSEGNVYEIVQDWTFILGGLLTLAVGVLALLASFNMVRRKVMMVAGMIAAPLMVLVLYLDFASIKNTVDTIEFKKQVRGEMALRITDIKDAQAAYKTVHGKYCDNVDELVKFVKTGKVPQPVSFGNIPERTITPIENDSLYPGENRAIDNYMSEMEAWRLSKIAQSLTPEQLDEIHAADPNSFDKKIQEFRRDTVFVPVIEKYFSGNKYLDKRQTLMGALNFRSEFDFHPDSLVVIPHTSADAKFGVATGEVFKSTGPAPTLLIWAVHPMDSLEMDSIFLGNLKKVDFNGSWQ